MSNHLAIYFVSLIISDLMKHTSIDFSPYEYEPLENRLMQGRFDEVENFIKKYL